MYPSSPSVSFTASFFPPPTSERGAKNESAQCILQLAEEPPFAGMA